MDEILETDDIEEKDKQKEKVKFDEGVVTRAKKKVDGR